MSNLVIPAPKQITIPIHESDQEFPVRRIYCIGRNYAAHTIEMGFDPDKEPPFFFQKNTDNIDISGEFPYPPESKDVHYELELIVALKVVVQIFLKMMHIIIFMVLVLALI